MLLSRFPIFTKKLTFSIFESDPHKWVRYYTKRERQQWSIPYYERKKYRLSLNTECLGSGEIPTLISQGNEGQRSQEE